MTLMTVPVRSRILELVDHFIIKQRPAAALNLINAVQQAIHQLDDDPHQGKSYPGSYRQLTRPNVRWIRVHRYWFGYRWEQDRKSALLVKIVYDQADMPPVFYRMGQSFLGLTDLPRPAPFPNPPHPPMVPAKSADR